MPTGTLVGAYFIIQLVIQSPPQGGIKRYRDPSVCPSLGYSTLAAWRSCLGYRHAGCLQLTDHQRCAECAQCAQLARVTVILPRKKSAPSMRPVPKLLQAVLFRTYCRKIILVVTTCFDASAWFYSRFKLHVQQFGTVQCSTCVLFANRQSTESFAEISRLTDFQNGNRPPSWI